MKHLTRRSCIGLLVSGVLLKSGRALAVDASRQLAVRLEGDYLRVSAPHFNFLTGKPLERLKEGATVAFLGQVSVSTSPNAVEARSLARFALSYDIWEEKFSVTRIGAESRRTVSHLSASGVESWCLENLIVDRGQIPPDKPFFVQLDLRVEDPREQTGIVGEPGINITRLIEVFSRPPRGTQPRWVLAGGPYNLSDLKRTELKGGRG